MRPRVQVIAHRGARAIAPENTIEAIEAAAKSGADAVEIDVQLSQDGVVVVVHDDTPVRTTDVRERFPDRAPWSVADFALDDLRLLDAGSWFVAQLALPAAGRQPFLRSLDDDERARWIDDAALERHAAGDVRIPTLAACIDACARLGLGLQVELKAVPHASSLVERVLDTIVASDRAVVTTLSSFDHRLLAQARALDPTRRIAALTGERVRDPVGDLARLGATAWHPGCRGDDALDVATIGAVRAAGHEVNVWTENDPARMRLLIDAGVTGIITDYPHRLRALVDARPGGQPASIARSATGRNAGA